ncbi:hypothetical protein AVEN_172140-1 [Araneus ventricosus]|uniref:Uncharacterized protein n=1 Tax=Araneus ventricosus TaxID=182803 RepID=A0A4Y2K0K7_ARAVE|nr:hypothetical protein AVEN_172140-1 [Araneus ventricosus]
MANSQIRRLPPARTTFSFPISFSLPPKATVVHSETRNTYRNGKSESLTDSTEKKYSEERIRSFQRVVPFGRTRVLSFLLRIRIFGFVPE